MHPMIVLHKKERTDPRKSFWDEWLLDLSERTGEAAHLIASVLKKVPCEREIHDGLLQVLRSLETVSSQANMPRITNRIPRWMPKVLRLMDMSSFAIGVCLKAFPFEDAQRADLDLVREELKTLHDEGEIL